MRPVLGLVVLSFIGYAATVIVAVVLSMTTRFHAGDWLPLVGFGAIFLGALFMSAGKNKPEDVYEKAFVTGGGTFGDVKVWPRLDPKGESEQQTVFGPSELSSARIVRRTGRSWLTLSFLGFAMIISGIAAALTVVLASLG